MAFAVITVFVVVAAMTITSVIYGYLSQNSDPAHIEQDQRPERLRADQRIRLNLLRGYQIQASKRLSNSSESCTFPGVTITVRGIVNGSNKAEVWIFIPSSVSPVNPQYPNSEYFDFQTMNVESIPRTFRPRFILQCFRSLHIRSIIS